VAFSADRPWGDGPSIHKPHHNLMSAGYSKRALHEKLGIKPGSRCCILNPPRGYDATLGEIPTDAKFLKPHQAPLDFIQLFTKERSELEAKFPTLKHALVQRGMLWISWPKGASKVPTDLNENIVREIGLKNQMVDIKVCAVDEVWSGLKFVYRLRDRKGNP